jgi:transcriptional regulator with XRE-family HTH domain
MANNNGGGRKADYPIKSEDRHMTLQEIADILGTSRERVRQIEQRALGKLRRKLTAMGYKPEDFFGQIIDTPSKSAHIRPE